MTIQQLSSWAAGDFHRPIFSAPRSLTRAAHPFHHSFATPLAAVGVTSQYPTADRLRRKETNAITEPVAFPRLGKPPLPY